MNIYSISWTSFGSYGLSAAVVAESEQEVMKLLDFSDGEAEELVIRLLGTAREGVQAHIIAKESL